MRNDQAAAPVARSARVRFLRVESNFCNGRPLRTPQHTILANAFLEAPHAATGLSKNPREGF